MTELPLVVVNVQRAGPSTGMPTRTEQSDLLMSLFGRNGECPLPIVAVSQPSDAFDTAREACRIAVQYMTRVFLLSDGFIANGSEPWKLPELSSLEEFQPRFATDAENFKPYGRNPETLARLWALPGTTGMEHRIGGLEKQEETGNISYDPDNHQRMTDLRAAKVEQVAETIPALKIDGPESGQVLVLGWGGTYGAIAGAVHHAQEEGLSISHLHLRHLNPFPKDLEETLGRFEQVVVPELNMGQLSKLLRARYLLDVIPLTKVQGQPFKVSEILACLRSVHAGDHGGSA